mgnify:CR=1 FL=1
MRRNILKKPKFLSISSIVIVLGLLVAVLILIDFARDHARDNGNIG